ncbi:MAG: SDR family oxidoreductase [Deltaproteobacteria bacterium]|nr:SDR family oxidoreductase [Deltaproteobacteria bacterium]
MSLKNKWALILGASSGMGHACARELANQGMNICGVHLDRKATLPEVEKLVQELKNKKVEVRFFNINASDPEKRKEVISHMQGCFIKIFLHSLAFGSLKPFFAENSITSSQMNMTLDVMAHSLVYWTQDLFQAKLLGKGSKVFAMTSAGGERVWESYGAVSSAKAALESHIRQIALELAPYGIAANALRAGVTNTPALRKIPGHEKIVEECQKRNPGKRLTTPEDIACHLAALSEPDNPWLTGNVIGIDGGENNVG